MGQAPGVDTSTPAMDRVFPPTTEQEQLSEIITLLKWQNDLLSRFVAALTKAK